MHGLRSLVTQLVAMGLVAIALVVLPSTAGAQDTATPAGPTAEQRAHARELYGQGQAAYTAEHYQQALEAYQAAFREVPNPVVLLGVALAQEHLGQREEARLTLERYLILRPDAPDRASVETRIAALPAPTTGTVHVACTPEGASIELDGQAIGTGTVDTSATAGTHELHITLAGHQPITRSIDVQAGHRVDVELTLVESAEVASEGGLESAEDVFGDEGADGDETATTTEPPAETPPPADPSVGVWVTTAIAGVSLVTGTIFGFLALSRQSDFDAMPTAGAANDGETFALVADIAFVAAAISGVTAIVLYATERPSPSADTAASLRVVPVASPTMAGVALGGSF
jgi:tetratricopeptide (TPR) repeat protein